MLSVLSSFIQDGPSEQALQSGGIYWWGNLHGQPSLPSPSGSVEIDIRSMRRLAFYQIALAVACRVASSKPGMPGTSPDRSEPFFSRAVALLGNPLDASHSSIGAVSVLNLMAFYLLQSDRPEASALYIGVAARSVLSLGAHRGHVDERGKRVFWTLYILDRELSCLLGRPPAIPDHAITLSMPAEVDGMPSPAGLCAHVELSRVSERITSTLGPSDGPLYDAEKSLALLDKWQSKLPAHLRLSTEGVSDDSATCNLHMLAIHLVVLSHRPALIGAVKAFNLSAASTCTLSPSEKDSCKSSALHIMRLARHTATLHQPRRLLRSALRFVFSSALCLVVLSMLGADDDAESAYEIEFAKGLFDREAQSGNTYGQSCAATLRELQALAAQVKGEATAMELEQAIESHLVPTSSWHGMSLFSEDAMGLDTMTALENDVLSWMDQEDNL